MILTDVLARSNHLLAEDEATGAEAPAAPLRARIAQEFTNLLTSLLAGETDTSRSLSGQTLKPHGLANIGLLNIGEVQSKSPSLAASELHSVTADDSGSAELLSMLMHIFGSAISQNELTEVSVQDKAGGTLKIKFDPETQEISALQTDRHGAGRSYKLDLNLVSLSETTGRIAGKASLSAITETQQQDINLLAARVAGMDKASAMHAQAGENQSRARSHQTDEAGPTAALKPAETEIIRRFLAAIISGSSATHGDSKGTKTSTSQGASRSTPAAALNPLPGGQLSADSAETTAGATAGETQTRSQAAAPAPGKISLEVNVDKAMKANINIYDSQNRDKSQLEAASQSLKQRLQQLLAEHGVDASKIDIKSIVATQQSKAGAAAQMLDLTAKQAMPGQTLPAAQGSESASGADRPSQLQISGIERILRTLTETSETTAAAKKLKPQLQAFARDLQQALTGNKPVSHKFVVESEAAAQELQARLKPVLAELQRQNVDLKQVTVAVKTDSKDSAPAKEIDLLRTETTSPGNRKTPAAGADHQKHGDTLRDQAGESGRRFGSSGTGDLITDTKSPGAQPFSKNLAAHKNDSNTRQAAEMLGAGGRPPQFDVVNGKIVADQPVEQTRIAEMIRKIAEVTQNQTQAAGNKLEVQLDIKNVGKVLIDAIKQTDRIHLQVQVDSNDMRRMLEIQLRPLIEQLARDGIDIGKLDVSVRDQKTEQQYQETPGKHTNNRQASKSDDDRPKFGQGEQQRGRSQREIINRMRAAAGNSEIMDIWA